MPCWTGHSLRGEIQCHPRTEMNRWPPARKRNASIGKVQSAAHIKRNAFLNLKLEEARFNKLAPTVCNVAEMMDIVSSGKPIK